MSNYPKPATCPDGTKLWFLNLGNLACDEAFLLAGAGAATESNPKPESKRRNLVVMAVLIEMPGVEGLILFETGCSNDLDTHWGPLQDVFKPNTSEETTLPAQIKKAGHDIKGVKHIIMGHLHLDHAGGLDSYFKGRTDITVYVHEEELKHSFWAVATKMDYGVYLPHYLSLDLKWETFNEKTVELFPGLHLVHSPGHSPGLVIMVVHLAQSGTTIFTTDQYHVKENYQGHPHGWLGRDYNAWYHSHCNIKRMAQRYDAKMCFGHDWEVFQSFKANPEYYE